MRKKIFNSLCGISAAVAISMMLAIIAVLHYIEENARTWGNSHMIYIVVATLIIYGIAVFIAILMAEKIVRPLMKGENDYEELRFLNRQIVAQNSELKHSTDELEEKELNLSFIVANISEGLILLDRRGMVISINSSAYGILGIKEIKNGGGHIFAINNDPVIKSAIHNALGGNASSDVIQMPSCVAEITVTPVIVEKAIRGVVIFLRDVTERQAAEKMRREFSATVSHELKTPLTSISGYAELLKEGMAQSEDTGWISAKIYEEAQHLISLTEDIMRISRLDEGNKIPVEEINLLKIANDVVDRLADVALKKNVKISLIGGDAIIMGNPRLIDEMIYNLSENAIKYNKPDGSVAIKIEEIADEIVLSVSDTGVGISIEDQSRVFERFYRVDKSHSKSTGGTGLGLSIVKNGAIFHKASLKLNSKSGEGTEIILSFKKPDFN